MALEQVGDLGWAEARRCGDKDMDVVLVRFNLQEAQPLPLTAFVQKFLAGSINLGRKDPPAILWDPDQMAGDGVLGVSGRARG
jgi:hypothetical protein